MNVKKYLAGIVVLLVSIFVVNTAGLHDVFAQSYMGTANTIEVELNDDFFNPKDIVISSGETTTLRLKNNGQKKHTFTVEKLDIDVVVQSGEEKTITVKPNKPGTYELICRYHSNEGMVGKVIVK